MEFLSEQERYSNGVLGKEIGVRAVWHTIEGSLGTTDDGVVDSASPGNE